MRYVFLGNNYRDLSQSFFKKLIEIYEFVPVVILLPDEKKKTSLNNEIVIRITGKFNNKIFNYDYFYVFDYYWRRNRLYSGKNNIENFLYPCSNSLYLQLNFIKKDDIIVSGNCGEWTSRVINQWCALVNARHYFYENFFFSDMCQVSRKSFFDINSELNNLVKKNTVWGKDDELFLSDYLSNKKSKYEQVNSETLKFNEYHSFVVGQLPYDTNIILVHKEFKNTEEMAIYLAEHNPDKNYVFKFHPKLKYFIENEGYVINKKIYNFPNMEVHWNISIHEIFKRVKYVDTISSTVGIEAQLYNLQVIWHSDTNYKYFNLGNIESRLKFVHACREYMIDPNNNKSIDKWINSL